MPNKPQDYETYIAKFKRKPTSDDTFTPPNVYEAVKGWAVREYHLEGRPVVRPFWPDGDYEKYDYPKGCVVIDNPPFSILAKILRFYLAKGIDFFLFAPALTQFGSARHGGVNYVTAHCDVTFENGASVKAGFCTNLGDFLIDTAPDLRAAINRENDANERKVRKTLRKLALPLNILTAARCGYLSTHGVRLRVRREDAAFVSGIDNMKGGIYGGGFLISDRAAAERAAAERAAAERAAADRAAAERAAAERTAAERYELSERELEVVKKLSTPK